MASNLCPRCNKRPRVPQNIPKHPFKAYCVPCEKEYQREYRQKNKEKIRDYQHEYAAAKWARIKADPKLHLEAVELRRMYNRLNGRTKSSRVPIYTSNPKHLLVDGEPLRKFVLSKLEIMGLRELCLHCDIHDRTLYRLLHDNKTGRVSFYVADQICTAFRISVYQLYPEMLD